MVNPQLDLTTNIPVVLPFVEHQYGRANLTSDVINVWWSIATRRLPKQDVPESERTGPPHRDQKSASWPA